MAIPEHLSEARFLGGMGGGLKLSPIAIPEHLSEGQSSMEGGVRLSPITITTPK